MKNEKEAYIAFNLTDKVGFATVQALAKSAGSVAAAWEMYPNKVSRSGGEVDLKGELERAKRYGVNILTPVDADYPESLRASPGCPLALYVKGSVKALSQQAVAIVGTRRATQYGIAQANRFGYDLAKAGWMVLSGLALGIDAEAHRGALEAGGVTVGILGSGLDEFYPEENRELAREIVKKGGAVVSEFPFGRPPDKETFPIRNHIVATLAKGVLAIESPVKGGTLITTSIAADLGRAVMALPGRVDSRMSAGCLNLIRDGATLVRCADDVLEVLCDMFPTAPKRKSEEPQQPLPVADADQPLYSVEEAMIMLHVDEQGIAIDDLVRATGLPAGKVNALVMTLRIKGFIKFLPGNRISALTSPRNF